MKRILIATPLSSGEPGGPAQYAIGLREGLIALGHTVRMITFSQVRKYPTGIRHALLFVQAIAHMRHVDVVVILDTVSMAIPIALVARLLGKPYIVRVGGDFVWEHYIERTHEPIQLSQFYSATHKLNSKEKCIIWVQRHIVFPKAQAVVFSTAWQRLLWTVPYNLTKSNVTVIENAYMPIEKNTESYMLSRPLGNIVAFGRNVFLKNYETLTLAVDQVRSVYPEATLSVYTNIPHAQVIEILKAASILVIPSFSEVSPNSALEAIACGTPVILTEDCGLREVLGDAVVWVDSRDPNALAHALITLMNPSQYNALRERMAAFNTKRTYSDVAGDFSQLIA